MALISRLKEKFLTKLLENAHPRLRESGRTFEKKVTPMKLDQALLNFMNGIPSAMDDVWNRVELDDHVSACMSSRTSATAGLNLDFISPEEGDQVKQQKEFLNGVFENIAVDQLIEDILEARYRLFSVIEPKWELQDSKFILTGWRKHEGKLFLFDSEDIYISNNGRKLDFAIGSDWYLAVKVRSKQSILLRVVKPYIVKTFGYDAWAHFIEVFSDPFRVGFYPDGANKEIRDQVFQAVYQIGLDGAAALPMSSKIEFIESAKTGGQTYSDLVEKSEKGISKAILGHSAAADATPGKLGEEGNALAVRDDLNKSDKVFVQRWLYKGFIRPLLMFNFATPAKIVPALIESKVISRDEKLRAIRQWFEMGLEINPQQAEEFGVDVQEEAPLLRKTTDFVF